MLVPPPYRKLPKKGGIVIFCLHDLDVVLIFLTEGVFKVPENYKKLHLILNHSINMYRNLARNLVAM